jgi:hypothetical protein
MAVVHNNGFTADYPRGRRADNLHGRRCRAGYEIVVRERCERPVVLKRAILVENLNGRRVDTNILEGFLEETNENVTLIRYGEGRPRRNTPYLVDDQIVLGNGGFPRQERVVRLEEIKALINVNAPED